MILLAFWLAASSAALNDPLAPAFEGKVQCYQPDAARKTCASIGAYEKDADGTIQNTATVLLRPEPRIVVRSRAPVVVKNGAICGVITERDLQAAAFSIDGEPADAANAEALRRAVRPGYAPLLNREVCTAYVPKDQEMTGQVSIDGKRRPALDQRVRWVSPAEGFRVAP